MKSNRQTRRTARALFKSAFGDHGFDAARARDIAAQLAESRRRSAPRVLSEFARLVRLHQDRHTALVETAAALSEAIERQVQETLRRRYGGDLTTSFAANPALLGGMRVRVGSDVYDATLRRRLNAIEAQF
jgi:F-type H+-transporting ATPase subunit delta